MYAQLDALVLGGRERKMGHERPHAHEMSSEHAVQSLLQHHMEGVPHSLRVWDNTKGWGFTRGPPVCSMGHDMLNAHEMPSEHAPASAACWRACIAKVAARSREREMSFLAKLGRPWGWDFRGGSPVRSAAK